eukprot:1549271-Rhodomonas_salina.1
MALKLETVNRWCVTGTPIQRGLEDIFGLLLFLEAAPFSHRSAWTHALLRPYLAGSDAAIDRGLRFLKQIMWRTRKDDVLDQIGVPAQTEVVRKLTFSPVEAHFYRRQHQ